MRTRVRLGIKVVRLYDGVDWAISTCTKAALACNGEVGQRVSSGIGVLRAADFLERLDEAANFLRETVEFFRQRGYSLAS